MQTRSEWPWHRVSFPNPSCSICASGWAKRKLNGWLAKVLTGEPNAGHRALAQLARAGARVWTVNFDKLIEQAEAGLEVLAWPGPPTRAANLVKPHGTLGGQLIVGSDQVLRGLTERWRERLTRDTAHRTVVFLGYSGRDLDFQPVWDSVLGDTRKVLWFDQPDPDSPGQVIDEARRRLLLRRVDARGALRFMPAEPPPASTGPGSAHNSAADFVRCCSEQTDVTVEPRRLVQMYSQPNIEHPPLTGELGWARASMLGHLGDFKASQAQRRRPLLRQKGSRVSGSPIARRGLHHFRNSSGASSPNWGQSITPGRPDRIDA